MYVSLLCLTVIQNLKTENILVHFQEVKEEMCDVSG
jgi:hypothetical protein